MINETTRDGVEQRMIQELRGHISPITLDDIVIVNSLKDGNFGRSLLGLTLYCNGTNLRGKSSNFPLGLRYYDGDNLFGIGYFRKEGETEDKTEGKGYIHIIAPTGPTWTQAVDDFIQQLKGIGIKNPVYLRHLTPAQADELIKYGKTVGHTYENVSGTLHPWHPSAYLEDETFNHRLVDLEKLLGGIQIYNPDLNRAYNRFSNFLRRNNLNLIIEKYSDEHQSDAQDIVRSHFEMLRSRSKQIGSTPEDYQNIIDLGKHNPDKGIYSYVGNLTNEDCTLRLLIMFFAGETIDQENQEIGLYATITMRNNNKLPQWVDKTGFTAVSEYCYVEIFRKLIEAGIKRADLGGSETEGLGLFKRDKLSAKEKITIWLVYEFKD